MYQVRRQFSKFASLSKSREIKPVYRPHHANPKNEPRAFEKHLPITKKDLKPWEVENISKDRFFKRKYGHMSDDRRKTLKEKVARQRRYREMKKAHEKQKLEATERFKRSRDEINYEGQSAKEILESGNSGGGLNTFFEFVYGTHPIKSVLQARKRPILGLYTFNADDENGVIKQAKKEYGIKVQHVRDKNALNILSKNGVHNGLVLKTKALDIPYIKNCGHVENCSYTITVEDDDGMDLENERHVLRKKEESIDKEEELFPLALFLDEITDPQNMGSILRTAYFFGVDFIVIPDHSSAKLGPVANKASSGALDLIDIYQTDRSLKFIDSVRENGWNVISTSAKPDELNLDDLKDKNYKLEMSLKDRFIQLGDLKTVLKRTPVMLVVGSEGKGVRTNMKLRSDYLVGIKKHRDNDDIVDSLNVGVATGVIIQSCL